MNRKKTLLALVACIVLFAGAVLFALAFDGSAGNTAGNSSPVLLSEILASNRTYPAPNGQFLDYIEVHNTTDSPIDISGYMLGDQPDTVGYTFPNGTVLPAHSYIVCWCDKESESDSYAKFGISKKGEDTIYLYNSSNVVVDTFCVPAINDNVPLIRQADGTWAAGTHASPGFENTEEGFAQWLQSTDTEHVDIVITEVMPGGGYTIVNGVGKQSDWVELYNSGSSAVELEGAFLSDDSEDRTKWVIPTLTIQPGERILIRCAGSTAETDEANFALARDGGAEIGRAV